MDVSALCFALIEITKVFVFGSDWGGGGGGGCVCVCASVCVCVSVSVCVVLTRGVLVSCTDSRGIACVFFLSIR